MVEEFRPASVWSEPLRPSAAVVSGCTSEKLCGDPTSSAAISTRFANVVHTAWKPFNFGLAVGLATLLLDPRDTSSAHGARNPYALAHGFCILGVVQEDDVFFSSLLTDGRKAVLLWVKAVELLELLLLTANPMMVRISSKT